MTSSKNDVPRSSSNDQDSSIDVVSLIHDPGFFCLFGNDVGVITPFGLTFSTCPLVSGFSSSVIRRGFVGPFNRASGVVVITLLLTVVFSLVSCVLLSLCPGVDGVELFSWLFCGNENAD